MPTKSISRRTVVFLFTMLFLCGALVVTNAGSIKTPPLMSSIEGVQGPCAATTDAEIVAAVQAKIKADARFNDQWKHINVSSLNRVVTVNGWTKGSAQVNTLIRFARTTKCVRRVINKVMPHLRVGCGAGQKQCGDICIDRNEQCNLLQDGGPPQ